MYIIIVIAEAQDVFSILEDSLLAYSKFSTTALVAVAATHHRLKFVEYYLKRSLVFIFFNRISVLLN